MLHIYTWKDVATGFQLQTITHPHSDAVKKSVIYMCKYEKVFNGYTGC